MKIPVFTSILMIHMAIAVLAQDQKTVHAPNFLVENQLSPEALKVEFSTGVSTGGFQNAAGIENQRIERNTFSVSGSPFPVINKEHQQLYFGFGWMREDYKTSESPFLNGLDNKSFHNISINAFYNIRLRKQYYLTLFQQHSIQSTHPLENMQRSYHGLMLTRINYKMNKNTNLGLGAVYLTNFGEHKIIPAISFVHSAGAFVANIDFPVKAEVEGLISRGKWRPMIGVLFSNSTYHINSADQYFKTSGMTGYVGLRYRLAHALYIQAAWQSVLNEEIAFGPRGHLIKAGDAEGQNRIMLSLNVQIPVKGKPMN